MPWVDLTPEAHKLIYDEAHKLICDQENNPTNRKPSADDWLLGWGLGLTMNVIDPHTKLPNGMLRTPIASDVAKRLETLALKGETASDTVIRLIRKATFKSYN
jgi:hypothetical protein